MKPRLVWTVLSGSVLLLIAASSSEDPAWLPDVPRQEPRLARLSCGTGEVNPARSSIIIGCVCGGSEDGRARSLFAIFGNPFLFTAYAVLLRHNTTGVECALNIDDCEREPCQNGGRCVDGVADYTCQCLPEDTKGVLWGGENCSVRLTGCQLHFCQNEATCIPTYEGGTHGYLCQCRAGFYDELCSTATTFSFTSNGYVIYDFSSVNRTKRETTNGEFSVSLRFRTTLPDLLIFYQGGEADFLFLEVYKGLLHVMMRSNDTETHLLMNETMVADGQWHQVEVSLEEVMRLTLGHEDCSNGSCTKYHPVNSDWSLSDSSSRMYIGGLNEGSLLSNTRSQQNFTGCLEDLRINSRTILPTDLTSDISYQMNLGCSKTEWCQPNPCFNAGRCIDLWTSFRCDCIRPYEGTTCLQEYVAGTFNFEGSPSLASFTIDENLGTNYDFSVFLRTMKPSGLLIQVGNYTTTCLNVYLQDGRINIATSPGNNVTFPENLADGATHMITLHFKDGEVAITYQSKLLNLGQIAPVALEPGYHVYVGGHPFEERIDFWGGYFKGCLQDLRLNDYRLEFFPLQIDNYSLPQEGFVGKMRNITESCISDDTCGSSPCKNGGNCTVTWNDFDCNCTSNFTGKTCEELVWCESLLCPLGTQCQNLPGGYMCLANATFQGSSALEYTPKTTIEKDLTAISLDFRTRDMDAVLFHATRGVDSVQILIENFLLLVNILSGNSIEGVTFRSETPVSDATWHHLFLSMEDPLAFSSSWIADLDNLGNVTLQGSAGNLNFMQDKVSIVLAENFTGCLGRVSIGGIYLPYIEAQNLPQRDQFVRSSLRTVPLGCRGLDVCSKSPCLHNGECQDLFNSFSCACTPAWEGPRCQSNVDDCKSSPCIHGKCIDLEADYRCMCFPGYTGRSCETNVNDCQHHRCLNGGTCIDGINTYSCKCTSTYAGNHCQWPHPPDQCDKNFTCLNEGTCTSGIWGANCTCKAGFTGRNCEIDINECDSNPCLNGGTCQDSINMYKCLCNGSFTGGQCEKGIPVGFLTFPLLGVAVPVACGCLLLLFIGVLFMVFTARKRRQSEGTYSPSQQEVAGARLEMDNVMKMPPEERLI